MNDKPVTYAQLLETNQLIQACGDETYWLCVTRTVQGSKLFPVSPYILFSYLNAFYRYPELLRKIEAVMPAEEVADRARNIGVKLQASHLAWAMPCFYLLGRELLIGWGMIRPQDALDDVVTVMDFWKRFSLAWHRNDGHLTARDFGHRSQVLPDRKLEVFKADLHPCEPGDALHEAAQAFLATASQYGFLVSCESRISLTNSGPYRIDENRELIVRDFMDLAECSLPWLDGIAGEVPYNNLTVTMAARDCHFHLMDDWGSFESEPEFIADKLAGVGGVKPDPLTEGHIPVGMASREELTATFKALNAALKAAMDQLWLRQAEWSRDQFVDAGALTYYSVCKELAHVAGVFEVEDWLEIDPRAERFRPIFNDEYGDAALGELVGLLSLPQQQVSPFVMMQHADRPVRLLTPLPYSVLGGEDYVPSVGPLRKGASNLPPKEDRYRTSEGVLSLAEYNARVRAFTPEVCNERFRHLCETWVKYNPDDPRADELYKLDQTASRTLAGKGVA
jgi:hypothetical protein